MYQGTFTRGIKIHKPGGVTIFEVAQSATKPSRQLATCYDVNL